MPADQENRPPPQPYINTIVPEVPHEERGENFFFV